MTPTTEIAQRNIHVLLDLDGTLSDSSPGIGKSLQHAFTTCGYPPPTEEGVRMAIGPPFEVSFPTLGVPAADVERVARAYHERYEDVGLFENTVYPGIIEMLDEFAEAGFVVSLATAKPQVTAMRIIEHFGLAHHFAVQAGASRTVGSGRRTKAQVITYALGELGLAERTNGHRVDRHRVDRHRVDHVVMVGDRDHDVEGARHNGIDCIGVTWGFGSAEELSAAGACALVDSPGEVAAAVVATYRSSRP